MSIQVKICGLSSAEMVSVAVDAGAAFVGAVFFDPSPRNVTPAKAARMFASVPVHVMKVGLFVDPDDAFLQKVLDTVDLDILQLHGTETVERVRTIRNTFQFPVMKAISVSGKEDLEKARFYEPHVDWLLFDAKPPKDSVLPGGNAVSFDWTLMADTKWSIPWMLAGGLDASNAADAIKLSGAKTLDVSSGVESTKGIKDPDKIRAFMASVKET